jgi:predicted nuclease of predicted toxin-antitoxin system
VKFKYDENLPADLGDLFRAGGHDAHSVLDEQMRGAADPIIAKVCQDEQRILITLDLDFSNIKTYPPQDYHGIIVLRLVRQDRDTVLAIMPRILALLQSETIAQRLWIVDDNRTRIRGGIQPIN